MDTKKQLRNAFAELRRVSCLERAHKSIPDKRKKYRGIVGTGSSKLIFDPNKSYGSFIQTNNSSDSEPIIKLLTEHAHEVVPQCFWNKIKYPHKRDSMTGESSSIGWIYNP